MRGKGLEAVATLGGSNGFNSDVMVATSIHRGSLLCRTKTSAG